MATITIDLNSLNGTNGFRLDGVAELDKAGISVSKAGDVNGDGFDDVIIGSSGADPNGDSSGANYIVFGKNFGFNASLNLSELDGSNGFRVDGVAEGDQAGISVSNAGDVNGDRIDDVIIGASKVSLNDDSAGASYLVFGNASGFSATMDLSALDGRNGFQIDRAGYSVSSAGDINGDGFGDVIVGLPFADPNNNENAGSSYVIFGKAAGFNASLNVSMLNGINGFNLNGEEGLSGLSVSNAGDVNGDGFSDLIIGASETDQDGYDFGTSYVVFGKATDFDASMNLNELDGSNGFRLDGVAEGDFAGISVSSAGDINGDGFGDVIIGAYAADPNGNSSGSSYVVFGKATDFDPSMNLSKLDGSNGFRLDGVVESDYLGSSVSGAGDINNDGFGDLVIGAPGLYFDQDHPGACYVVLGKATGFRATLDFSNFSGSNNYLLDSIGEGDHLGSSVSGAGDVNGDGYDDIIVGAPDADPMGDSSGTSYVIFGSSNFSGGIVIEGTPENDILVGDDRNENLSGYEGNDNLSGNDGNDTLDGGIGNDVLIGGLGDDIILAGFEEDNLSGNDGNDIFGFYAIGHFEVQDLSLAEDRIYLGAVKTGLSSIDDINQLITAVDQREDGVKVEFGPDASINLIGINFVEITAEMIGFA